MRKPVIYLWFPALVLFSIFISCRESVSIDASNPSNTGTNNSKNLPVTGNVPNSFSFVVDANSFNYNKTEQVQIGTDSLTIGITISNFIAGSGKIIVKDNNGVSIYEKDLSAGMVSGEVLKLTSVPKTITMQLINYTGKVVLGLAGK